MDLWYNVETPEWTLGNTWGLPNDLESLRQVSVVLLEAGRRDLGVDLGGLEVRVAEDLLEAFHGHAFGEGEGGEGVSSHMECKVVRHSAEDPDPLKPLVQSTIFTDFE